MLRHRLNNGVTMEIGASDLGTLPDRVFVKPRRGSASLDTYEVDRRDLASVLAAGWPGRLWPP